MFKKLTSALVITLGLVGGLLLGGEEVNAKSETVVVSNVGDGQEYAYEITEVKGKEIHGVALNKKSYTNGGIFLYKEEVGFDVKVGDKIIVVWGQEEDEFESIEKAVLSANGEYVGVSNSEVLNKEHTYEIVGFNGDEVYCEALNGSNLDVLLYQGEIDFNVKKGDKIIIVWGSSDDEFEMIDRAVEVSRGKYVSETKIHIKQLLNKLSSKNK